MGVSPFEFLRPAFPATGPSTTIIIYWLMVTDMLDCPHGLEWAPPAHLLHQCLMQQLATHIHHRFGPHHFLPVFWATIHLIICVPVSGPTPSFRAKSCAFLGLFVRDCEMIILIFWAVLYIRVVIRVRWAVGAGIIMIFRLLCIKSTSWN